MYDIAAITIDNTLSVNENSLTNAFTIYPNPTVDIIKIKTKHILKDCTIVDVNGKIVMKNNFKLSTNINVSKLSFGTYFMIISSDAGRITKKIIKEK